MLANTSITPNTTPNSNEKLLNKISTVIGANRYVAKAIQNAALKWGDITNPKATEIEVIAKIFKFFQKQPEPAEKCNAENISALASIIENKGLSVPVTDQCFSSHQIQLSIIALKNEHTANKTKSFVERLGEAAGNVVVNAMEIVANGVGLANDAVKLARSTLKTTGNSVDKIITGVGDGGQKMLNKGLKNSHSAVTSIVTAGGKTVEAMINPVSPIMNMLSETTKLAKVIYNNNENNNKVPSKHVDALNKRRTHEKVNQSYTL
jgi:hypothetical protein